MKYVQVIEAKAKFSALLEQVAAGEEIAITKHGKVVARLVPDAPRMAADAFRPFWKGRQFNVSAPVDLQAEAPPRFD